MASLHERYAEILLKFADRRRQGRLGDMAGIGGASEMPLFGERHEIGEMAAAHFDPLAEHRGRPTPSGIALRVRPCNFGPEAARPRLVETVEKAGTRSKLRVGPERHGSFQTPRETNPRP